MSSHLGRFLGQFFSRAKRFFSELKKSRRGRVFLVLVSAVLLSGSIFVMAELGGYGVNGPATAPNSLDYGLVGYWDMEEGSGQTLKDKSGNGNDATLGANSSAGADDPIFASGFNSQGPGGSGLQFDGVNDYALVSNSSSLGYANPTISWSLWARADSLPASGQNTVFLSRYIDGFSTQLEDTGHIYTEVYINSGTEIYFTSNRVMTAGGWHNYTTTFDGDTLKLYIDGVLDKSQSGAAATTFIQYANPWRIGARSTGARFFPGSIDEVRIYNRALSDNEVRLLYNQKKPILEMRFDEGSGTTAYDGSFNGIDGILGGDGSGTDVPSWVAGKHNGALSFDGDNDYVAAANATALKSPSGTVGFWINPSAITAGGSTVFHIFEDSMETSDYLRSYIYPTGVIDLVVEDGDLAKIEMRSTATIPAGQWTKVDWVQDGTGVKLYLNGQLSSATGTNSGSWWTDHLTSYNIRVGGSSSWGSVQGSMDDFRVYNYARTADEVLADYNDGMAVHLGESILDLTRGLVGYWDMEEGRGQVVKDKSGSGYDGTLGASSAAGADDPIFRPGFNSNGPEGVGIQFDGVNDYVNLGDGAGLTSNTGFTYSFWMKWMGSNKGGYGGLIEYLNRGDQSSRILIDDSVSKILIQCAGADTITSNITLQQGSFYYVTLSWDGSIPRLYVNGVLDATGGASNFSAATTNDVLLGIGASWVPTYYFNGMLDDLRIYNRALSVDEIRYLYNKKKPAIDMSFDEGSGTSAKDGSFNNNDGTLGGDGVGTDLPAWVSGKNGSALSFDGSDDYVSTDSTVLNGTSMFSVSFWIKPNAFTGTPSFIAAEVSNSDITSFGTQGPSYNGYQNTFVATIQSSSSGNTVGTVAKNNFATGNWYHYEAVYDGAQTGNENRLKIYINGVQQTIAYDGTVPVTSYDPGSGNKVRIGLSSSSSYSDGAIDNLRIYSYPRTADEVLVDYNDGQAAHLGKNENDLNYGLVGSWDFEEGSGLTAYDKSGSGNNGTLSTSSGVELAKPFYTTGHDASGEIGSGLGLTGKSEYVDAGTGSSLQLTNAGTIALWVKANSLSQDDFANFVTKRSNSNGGSYANYSYSFHWRGADNLIRLAISDGVALDIATMPLPTDLGWHHMVGLWNGTNLKLYMDGKLAMTPVAQTRNAQAGASFNTALAGYSFSSSAVGRQEFNGTLDEIRVYNRALSDDEIRMLYNQKKPVSDMRFDEGFGTIAYDDSFNNNDGTLGGDGSGIDLPVWTQGKFGSALSFDGSDDYINAGSGSSLNFGTGSYSASWWAKYPQTQSNTYATVFSKGFHTAASYANSFGMAHNNGAADGLRYYEIGDTTGSFATAVTLESNITDGWHHFGFIRDVDGNKLKLYDNGILVANVDYTADVNITNTRNLYLMKTHDGINVAVGGYLDEFRMYNYARTQDEVLVDYNNGLAAHLR